MTDFRHLEFIASCSIFVGIHGCLFKDIATKCLVAPVTSPGKGYMSRGYRLNAQIGISGSFAQIAKNIN